MGRAEFKKYMITFLILGFWGGFFSAILIRHWATGEW